MIKQQKEHEKQFVERLREINTELAELSQQFSENLLNETNEFELLVTDRADLGDLSDSLVELAADIGLDSERFAADLDAVSTEASLIDEIGRARALGINSFPSLAVVTRQGLYPVGLNYLDAQEMLKQIEAIQP